jgi:CRP-like cAMP-binding protein
MPTPSHPFDNHLLAALPEAEWARLEPNLERVSLALHQSIYESGQVLNHAYFPTTSILSCMYMTEAGASAESAVVGKDGMLGIFLLMGGGSTTSRAVVNTAGEAYRVPARVIKEEFARGGATMHLLLRYTQALLTQTAQRAVCTRHHTIAQQVASCLLLNLDRVQGDELVMTQELIAQRLGVRREGVTEGAYMLQKMGLIQYSRGRIRVLNRPGLERRACECYAVVRDECERLLPSAEREEIALLAA